MLLLDWGMIISGLLQLQDNGLFTRWLKFFDWGNKIRASFYLYIAMSSNQLLSHLIIELISLVLHLQKVFIMNLFFDRSFRSSILGCHTCSYLPYRFTEIRWDLINLGQHFGTFLLEYFSVELLLLLVIKLALSTLLAIALDRLTNGLNGSCAPGSMLRLFYGNIIRQDI